ncbi:MAG: leucine-rich repeat domain-containing protein, partial [Clostridiales bacterium]|nr:leucine-rich repeat domain-containing protein [Clostridiales bacterium]
MKHTRKRLLALLLALSMCLSTLSASAWATEADGEEAASVPSVTSTDTILDTGNCGDELTWTLYSDYELTISGTGDMTDWDEASEVPWYSYCSYITSVTIPDGVTSIGAEAFAYCESLTSVTIPSSVTSIGKYAFEYCTGLTSVTIPSSVTSIGNGAFRSCESLTSVAVPDSVTSIGSGAFSDCTDLETVTIGSGVTSIGSYVFSNCQSLTAITVDEENTAYVSVDGILFNTAQTTLVCYPAGKSGEYTIPSTVTAIGDYAFSYCAGLTAVTIPDGVTSIG